MTDQYICSWADKCDNKICAHKLPHSENTECSKQCQHGNFVHVHTPCIKVQTTKKETMKMICRYADKKGCDPLCSMAQPHEFDVDCELIHDCVYVNKTVQCIEIKEKNMTTTKKDLLAKLNEVKAKQAELETQINELETGDNILNEIIDKLFDEYDNLLMGFQANVSIKLPVNGVFNFDAFNLENEKSWRVGLGDVAVASLEYDDQEANDLIETALKNQKMLYVARMNKWMEKVKKVAKEYDLTFEDIMSKIFEL